MIMADGPLNQRRILVVEDEYLLADELASELTDEGAVVLGPVSNVQDALAMIAEEATLDGAILDVNLGGEEVFPVADILIDREVPLILTTGYDPGVLPQRYAHLPWCEKPISVARITVALGRAIRA